MLKKLDELLHNERGVITKINVSSHLRQRLLELGVREGKEIIKKADAPMGDPISVSIMGINLSLRKQIARHIWVEIDGKKDERV